MSIKITFAASALFAVSMAMPAPTITAAPSIADAALLSPAASTSLSTISGKVYTIVDGGLILASTQVPDGGPGWTPFIQYCYGPDDKQSCKYLTKRGCHIGPNQQCFEKGHCISYWYCIQDQPTIADNLADKRAVNAPEHQTASTTISGKAYKLIDNGLVLASTEVPANPAFKPFIQYCFGPEDEHSCAYRHQVCGLGVNQQCFGDNHCINYWECVGPRTVGPWAKRAAAVTSSTVIQGTTHTMIDGGLVMTTSTPASNTASATPGGNYTRHAGGVYGSLPRIGYGHSLPATATVDVIYTRAANTVDVIYTRAAATSNVIYTRLHKGYGRMATPTTYPTSTACEGCISFEPPLPLRTTATTNDPEVTLGPIFSNSQPITFTSTGNPKKTTEYPDLLLSGELGPNNPIPTRTRPIVTSTTKSWYVTLDPIEKPTSTTKSWDVILDPIEKPTTTYNKVTIAATTLETIFVAPGPVIVTSIPAQVDRRGAISCKGAGLSEPCPAGSFCNGYTLLCDSIEPLIQYCFGPADEKCPGAQTCNSNHYCSTPGALRSI